MGKYDDLLSEIREQHKSVIKTVRKFSATAKDFVPNMCSALAAEEIDGVVLSVADIRDRVIKDGLEFWTKDTIIDALPESYVRDYEITVTNDGQQIEGVIIPEDKFEHESVKKLSIQIKRTFNGLIKEAKTADEVNKIYNDFSYVYHNIDNIDKNITKVGREYRTKLFNPVNAKSKELRKPISVYDLDFTPTDEVKTIIDQIADNVQLSMKMLNDLLNGIYRYPIFTIDEATRMLNSSKAFLILTFNAVNNKSSQGIYDQLETNLLAEETSEPQAAKNSKTQTLVCKTCVKKFDPISSNDPPIMQVDANSPTNFRCPTCLGTEMCERGLTKDIVEQRKDFLQKVGGLFKDYPPLDFLQVYSKSVKERLAGTKKVLLSSLLRQSSMGSSREEFK